MRKNYLFLLLFILATISVPTFANQLQDGSKIKVAYITDTRAEKIIADEKILEKLNSVSDFELTIKDASEYYEGFDEYDLVILSPVPGAGSDGVISVLDKDIPVLLLKPFALKTGGWGWGTANNTSDAGMNILIPEHPVFEGLTLIDDQLTIYSEVSTNGIACVTAWTSILGDDGEIISPPVKHIASPISREDGFSIAEFEVGLEISGYTVKAPILMIGLSEFSTANITDEALQLLENSCNYLTDKSQSGISSIADDRQIEIIQTSEQISVNIADGTIAQLNIIGIDGKRISSVPSPNINIANLSAGVYLLQITTENSQMFVKKFIKK